MALLRQGRKRYLKPELRKYRSLEILKDHWKAVRNSIHSTTKHTKDYELAIAGIAEQVRTYDPHAGNVNDARAKLRNIEKSTQPTMDELRSALDIIEDMYRTLIATFDEILHHPAAKNQLKEAVLAEAQKARVARAIYAKMHANVEKLRTALLMKHGILMRRESKRR